MSFRIYILGNRPPELSRGEIAEFIREGGYFESPTFDPDPKSQDAAALDWSTFDIFAGSGSNPSRLHSEHGPRIADAVSIVEGTFDERGLTLPSIVSAQLATTRHVYVVEIDRGAGVSEDAWEMLASVEAFLAKRCGGIVFSSEDGVYDSELRVLVNFRQS